MLKNAGPIIPKAFSIAFLKGGAIIVILVWGILSFVPFFAMIYGDLAVGMVLINLLFGITGIASLGSLYLLFVFLASTEGRGAFAPRVIMRSSSPVALPLLGCLSTAPSARS